MKNDNFSNDESLKSLVASSAVVEVMAKVTPEINSLLESNMIKIGEGFTKIAESGRKLQDKADSGNSSVQDMRQEIADINSQIMQVIVGMQFQDRLSQNLVILKDISNEIKKSVEVTLDSLPKEVDKQILKDILGLIKLGEIRSVYIDYLVGNGYISGPEELDYDMSDEPSGNNDIELF